MNKKNTFLQISLSSKPMKALALIVMISLFSSFSPAEEIFSTPDNLKDNVAFWKKIYTEVSLQAGIIHDRDYPLIIYKIITIGNRSGRQRNPFLRQHIDEIKQWLSHIAKAPENEWTAKEKEVAALFRQYAPSEELATAPERIRFQLGQKERFREGLERSGAYLPFIQAIFQKYQIPLRIAYLPHVESSFNIKAYSRVGAAGMWQFMRSTGKIFLKVDYRVDERLDPYHESVAAARLLQQNYKKLQSWPLAITAYNHGLASMSRAVEVTGSRDLGVIIDQYKNRNFKFASKNFYGCFLAASEIAANPAPYFPNLTYHEPQKYHEIELKNPLPPKILAQQLGFSQEQIKALNPALRPIVFHRQLAIPKGYKIRLPLTLTPDSVTEKLASIPAAPNNSPMDGEHYYSVKRGDTLFGISRLFGVATESLIIANEISTESRLYIGQVLRIPRQEGTESGGTNVKGIPASTAPTSAKVQIPLKEIAMKKAEKIPDPTIVTSNLNSNIKTGTKTLPQKGRSIGKHYVPIFDATFYTLDTQSLPDLNQAKLTASVEESLGLYAEWLGISTDHLRQLNNNQRGIKIGQEIIIPLNSPGSLEQFNAKRLEYHMAQEEDFYNNYRVVDTKIRRVLQGDTLWSICNRDDEVPIWLFKKYNREIDIEALTLNMRLTIPVIAAIE